MKIIRVITRLNIGGPSIHSAILANGLNGDKFETLFIAGRIGKGEGDMSYLAAERNLKPIFINELQREINLFKDTAAFWKLFLIIKREKPDIVHTHTAKAGCLGRLAARLAGVPVIIHTFHGHIFDGYFGKIKRTFFLNTERFLAGFTNKIIAISPVQREYLKGALKIRDANKIVVVPLGFELDKFLTVSERGFLRNRFSISKNSNLIGIIGRLVPIKNHRMFLECAKILKDDLGFKNTKFIIVGDGELRQDLERHTKQLGLSSDVIFTGWIKDPEKIYQDLDVVTLTSLNEGTPVSLIEAMASGKAVVATDVGGVRDVIVDNETGLISESEPLRFAETVAKLLKDDQLRKIMGEKARAAVRAAFSKERLVADIENLYLQTLNSRI